MGAKPTIAQNVGLLTAANLLMRGVSMLFQVYLTARVGAAGVGLLQLILSVNLFAVTLIRRRFVGNRTCPRADMQSAPTDPLPVPS